MCINKLQDSSSNNTDHTVGNLRSHNFAHMQMVLLYKDHKGESIEETMTGAQTNGSGSKSNVFRVDSSELEGKIADLERKLTEKNETIDKMKSEMEAAQNVSILYVCCSTQNHVCFFTFSSQTQCLNSDSRAMMIKCELTDCVINV